MASLLRDRFTDRVSAGGALIALAVWRRARRRGRPLPRRLLAIPAGLADLAGRQLNAAIQEYHYLPHRGVPLGPWENAICHLDAWVVGDEDGKPYLEQHTGPTTRQPVHAARCSSPAIPSGSDYTVEAKVKPLSLDDMAGRRLPLSHEPPLLPVLADRRQQGAPPRAPAAREDAARGRVAGARRGRLSPTTPPATTRCKVENEGPRIRAYIDGKLVLEAERSARSSRARPASSADIARALPGFPRHAPPMRTQRAIAHRIAPARAGARHAARRAIRSRSSGRSSTRPSSAPAATCASAISTATACPTC